MNYSILTPAKVKVVLVVTPWSIVVEYPSQKTLT